MWFHSIIMKAFCTETFHFSSGFTIQEAIDHIGFGWKQVQIGVVSSFCLVGLFGGSYMSCLFAIEPHGRGVPIESFLMTVCPAPVLTRDDQLEATGWAHLSVNLFVYMNILRGGSKLTSKVYILMTAIISFYELPLLSKIRPDSYVP